MGTMLIVRSRCVLGTYIFRPRIRSVSLTLAPSGVVRWVDDTKVAAEVPYAVLGIGTEHCTGTVSFIQSSIEHDALRYYCNSSANRQDMTVHPADHLVAKSGPSISMFHSLPLARA